MRLDRSNLHGRRFAGAVAAAAITAAIIAVPAQAAPVTGTIWTSNSACTSVNQNQFNAKDDVYVNGGPTNVNNPQSGLPDGAYYVRVTEPNGTVLGYSTTASFIVVNGVAVQCYQLSAIVVKQSDGTPGYDTTTNNGGEYKVWVSQDPAFPNSGSKTDNFKVEEESVPPQEDESHLNVLKFYDTDTDGVQDIGEPFITGWKVNIADGINFDRFTPVDQIVAPDTYTVTEYPALESNWFLTTGNNPTVIPVAIDTTETVTFGNVCTGAGGGLTLGFWSNKNGGKILSANGGSVLAQVLSLNLRKANGLLLGVVNLSTFQSFLLSANASNMANMLSAQLAAMKANVAAGNVNGAALVYAPGALGVNANGFISVSALIAEADTELGLHGLTVSPSPFRPYQEALKNALDNANNNKNFAQSSPCAFSFAGP
jgi:hypothetical protein